MIEDTVNTVIKSLSDEKSKMVSFLNERMQSIVFPENETIECHEKVEKKDNTSLIVFGGGALGLLAGLCTGTKWLSVLGICVGTLGGVMYFRSKKGTIPQVPYQTNEVDYSKLSNMIYKTLESTHSHITKEWDNYLGQLNSMLKSEIRSSIADDDKKNELLDKVSYRTQIRFSMMDANTELLSSSRSKNVNAIKDTMHSLIDKYNNAIGQAYQEQLSIYNSMLQ